MNRNHKKNYAYIKWENNVIWFLDAKSLGITANLQHRLYS